MFHTSLGFSPPALQGLLPADLRSRSDPLMPQSHLACRFYVCLVREEPRLRDSGGPRRDLKKKKSQSSQPLTDDALKNGREELAEERLRKHLRGKRASS